jgi:hypothetical protein
MGDNTETVKKNERFSDQCFLMHNISVYGYNEGNGQAALVGTQGPDNYTNFVKLRLDKNTDTASMINNITTPPNADALIDMTVAQASSLVPYIKLYKTFYPTEKSLSNNSGEEYELLFENYLDNDSINSITSSRTGRGAGAGIRSFSWKSVGTNFYTAGKSFEGTLQLYFQGADALVKKRYCINSSGSNRWFSVMDLITPPPRVLNGESGQPRAYNPDYFSIKVAVGWSVPTDTLAKNVNFTTEQIAAIKSCNRVFNLGLVSHDLSFNEDGTIDLTIDCKPFIDTIISSPDSNVLAVKLTDTDQIDAKKKNVEKISQSEKQLPNGCRTSKGESEELKKAKEEEKEARRTANINLYSRLLTKIQGSSTGNNVFSTWVSTKTLEKYKAGETGSVVDLDGATPPIRKTPGALSKLKEITKNQKDPKKKPSKKDVSNAAAASSESSKLERGKGKIITFIYLGAIIDAALSVVNESKDRRDIKTIVGMIKYPEPSTGKAKYINIADIPISIELFGEWFYQSCISQQNTTWQLKNFLQALSSNLIRPALSSRCFDAAGRFRFRGQLDMKMSMYDFPNLAGGRDRFLPNTSTVEEFNGTATIPPTNLNKLDFVSLEDGALGLGISQYLMMFGFNQNPQIHHYENESERYTDDKRRKIYHLSPASERGIVKTITFSRTDIPFARERRLQDALDEGTEVTPLRELYDVDISTIGNTIWMPGSLFYLDLGGQFESEEVSDFAVKVGLQGYYQVITTDSTIENTSYTTTISGKYISSGRQAYDNANNVPVVQCPEENNHSTEEA